MEMRHIIQFSVYLVAVIITCEGAIDKVKIRENGEKLIPNSQPYKHVLKRYDQGYQTCLENFEIRDDKIIRTQDSREMGAKYINEFELSSRDECLRACCGTETCDVFVFEEKNPGSCYLFHCGPSDDFKCKFTKHHNYTSAILQTNRHMNELETQIKLTKHEQELARLRKPEITVQSTGSPVSTTVLVPGTPKETIPNLPTKANIFTSNRHCSSYHFQCRGSNECIAIYNACDGIPQCADGSDEAPELDCPTQGTTPPPAPPSRLTASPQTVINPSVAIEPATPVRNPYTSNLQQLQQQQQLQQEQVNLLNLQQAGQQSPLVDNQPVGAGYNQGPPFHQQNWQTPPLQQPQQQQQYQAQHNDLTGQPKMFPQATGQMQTGNMYGREGEGPGNNYNNQWNNNYPHGQPNQYPGSLLAGHPYDDGNSHIFNHKGNSLVADSDSPSNQYVDSNHNEYNSNKNLYPGGNIGGNNMYYNNAPYRNPMQPNSNWLPNQQPQGAHGDQLPLHNENELQKPDYYYEDNQNQEGRFHPPHDHDITYPHHHSIQTNAATLDKQIAAEDTMPKLQPKPAFVSSLETKMEEDLSSITQMNKGSIDFHVKQEPTRNYSKPVMEVTTQASTQKHGESGSVKKHKAELPHPTSVPDEVVVIESLEEDVSKPKGAILSLSLGMCICAIFMALVSCRIRMIRKRLRRGGKSPYTHDADYLVNGMYL